VQTLSVLFGIRKVIGTLGRELVRFEYNSREVTLRIGSNWYSLQPGVGGKLSQHSLQSNPGSHRADVFREQGHARHPPSRKWIFYAGDTRLLPEQPVQRVCRRSALADDRQGSGAARGTKENLKFRGAYSRACFR